MTNSIIAIACDADKRQTNNMTWTLCEVLTIGELEKLGSGEQSYANI